MSLYVDSSALLKRYLDETDADVVGELLNSDPLVATARVTVVEVRRNIARFLTGSIASAARDLFSDDIGRMTVVELDELTCELAASVAEITGVRSLEAVHLAAAQRAAVTTFLTFDLRQAQAARTLGLTVVGA